MAASGARSSGTIDISSSIYAKMDPSTAKQKLTDSIKKIYEATSSYPKQLWLLRESRVDGCLTLSCMEKKRDGEYKYFDSRYALVKTRENVLTWCNVNEKETIDKLKEQEKIVFMNMHTARKEENIDFCNVLFQTFEKKYFLAENYLNPSLQESSRNSAYINISQCVYIQNKLEKLPDTECSQETLERLERTTRMLAEQHEDQTCPITDEQPGEIAGISQTPHLYNLKALTLWIAKSGSDPMTRAPITTDDILPTHAPQKMNIALEELTRQIAMRHMKNT